MFTVINRASSFLNLILSNGTHHLLLGRCRQRSQAPIISSYRVLGIYSSKHGHRFLSNNIHHGLSLKILGAADSSKSETNRMNDMAVNGSSRPSPGPSSNWKTWVLGALLSLIIPFWRIKWTPFLAFKREVDTIVAKMDTAAEMVEKVAGGVEKIADEIAGSLPKDGKLREAVCFVENLAKEVAKDAHKADEFLDKIVEIEDEVEKGVETFIEPVVACINQEKENGGTPPQQQSPIVLKEEEEEEEEEKEKEKDKDTHTPSTTSRITTSTIVSNNEEKN